MEQLNKYITEAWSGVKQQTNNAEIEAWCEEMGIENYTINSKGEIDVDIYVDLERKNFKELPYKFGEVKGYFDISGCKNLTSLKNCPNYVEGTFNCEGCLKLDSLEGCPEEVGGNFNCSHNPKLDSLKGCPKEVGGHFRCRDCKREFKLHEVKSLCKVKGNIVIFKLISK